MAIATALALALAGAITGTAPVAAAPTPAVPAPSPSAGSRSTGTDAEGGTADLSRKLDEASRGYSRAKAAVQRSLRTQRTLNQQIVATTRRARALDAEVQRIGAETYRGAVPERVAALDRATDLRAALDGAALVDNLSRRRQRTITELAKTHRQLAAKRTAVNRELAKQERAERAMASRRAAAKKALAEAGSGGPAPGFGAPSTEPSAGPSTQAPATKPGAQPAKKAKPAEKARTAKKAARLPGPAAPAKRAKDGSWPSEGCSRDDPTTSGCLTARTVHALAAARAAGFTRYVACYRKASFGEHPKGRACDFAAAPRGFGGTATGADRQYGNRLAAWLVANADRLAVLYVIWFRQIWLPGTGWTAYRGGPDPSAAHTNHVHLSVQ